MSSRLGVVASPVAQGINCVTQFRSCYNAPTKEWEETVLYIRDYSGKEYYIIGTAHISEKSAKQVREVI